MKCYLKIEILEIHKCKKNLKKIERKMVMEGYGSEGYRSREQWK